MGLRRLLDDAFPGVPSTLKVCLKGNFDTNHIYELVYTAKNPTVAGIGFAATRDFVDFLRNRSDADRHGHDVHDGDGHDPKGHVATPPTPLGDSIHKAIIYGSSQSGRWIRTFLQSGFNEGMDGRKVFEGAIPHKSSNRAPSTYAGAQATRLSGTQHTETLFLGQETPQTWGRLHPVLQDPGASGWRPATLRSRWRSAIRLMPPMSPR